MASWAQMSLDSLKAANDLHKIGRARSAASRAYFAAYAAVTSKLPRGMVFAEGRPNPSHSRLHEVASNNAASHLSPLLRRDLARIVRTLRANRVASDYDQGTTVDDTTALQSVRHAARVLDLLEVV